MKEGARYEQPIFNLSCFNEENVIKEEEAKEMSSVHSSGHEKVGILNKI
jgi:hypothetical protein